MNRLLLVLLFLGLIGLSACTHKHETVPKSNKTESADSSGETNSVEQRNNKSPIDSLSVDGAIDLIQKYYEAINNHDYRQAYNLWGNEGAESKQTYQSFKNGYSETDSVKLTLGKPGRIEGAAGSRYIEIPVKLDATTTLGTSQRFTGTYVLRRTVIDGSTPSQRRWHIYSAHISKVSNQ